MIDTAIIFTASEALLADPTLANEALGYLRRAEGCQRIRQGYAVDEGTTTYFIITWVSHESYKKMLERSDYPSFMKAMKPLHKGPHLIWNFEFDVDSNEPLSAPITECATITPTAGHTVQQVITEMRKIQAVNPHYPTMHGVSIGKIKEDSGRIFVVIGWDSIKAHVEAAKTPPLQELIWEIIEVAHIEVNHVPFAIY